MVSLWLILFLAAILVGFWLGSTFNIRSFNDLFYFIRKRFK